MLYCIRTLVQVGGAGKEGSRFLLEFKYKYVVSRYVQGVLLSRQQSPGRPSCLGRAGDPFFVPTDPSLPTSPRPTLTSLLPSEPFFFLLFFFKIKSFPTLLFLPYTSLVHATEFFSLPHSGSRISFPSSLAPLLPFWYFSFLFAFFSFYSSRTISHHNPCPLVRIRQVET